MSSEKDKISDRSKFINPSDFLNFYTQMSRIKITYVIFFIKFVSSYKKTHIHTICSPTLLPSTPAPVAVATHSSMCFLCPKLKWRESQGLVHGMQEVCLTLGVNWICLIWRGTRN
jgi:hypothetical protein